MPLVYEELRNRAHFYGASAQIMRRVRDGLKGCAQSELT
jgi:hypothetical protein